MSYSLKQFVIPYTSKYTRRKVFLQKFISVKDAWTCKRYRSKAGMKSHKNPTLYETMAEKKIKTSYPIYIHCMYWVVLLPFLFHDHAITGPSLLKMKFYKNFSPIVPVVTEDEMGSKWRLIHKVLEQLHEKQIRQSHLVCSYNISIHCIVFLVIFDEEEERKTRKVEIFTFHFFTFENGLLNL